MTAAATTMSCSSILSGLRTRAAQLPNLPRHEVTTTTPIRMHARTPIGYTAGRQTSRSPDRVRRAALNGNTDKLRWASRSPQPRVPWRALRTGPLARGRQVRAGLPSRSDHGVPTPGCCWCFAARSHRMLRVRRPPSALPSAQEARTARWERDAIKQSRKGRMVEECTLHSSVWWE